MRVLIYIPIIHSKVDLGSIADELRRSFQEAFGAEQCARRFASVDAMWAGIADELSSLPLCWANARLYQDGLPICGREQEIVRDLAAQGSLNHRLLAELIARGATLMGTENPELMLREYRRAQRLVEAARRREPDSVAEELKREGEDLMRARDAFIAHRIDSTLAEGETGLLFLGLLHRVDELLSAKFEVRHVIHNLPFGTDPWQQMKEHSHGQ